VNLDPGESSTLEGGLVLLTYDSCRYDVLIDAHTPVLDSFGEVLRAQTPANFTYAAHMAFFAGILPNTSDDVPYYNRFRRQLIGLTEVGELQVVKDAALLVKSTWNVVEGLQAQGVVTIGAGAMNWFRQESLRVGFDHFRFTGTDARAQVDFILDHAPAVGPFFGFVNFGETHAPFRFEGKTDRCPVDVRARVMRWPPKESGPVGRDNAAYDHQRLAAEFLDRELGRLLSALPSTTTVVLCADHGECFGEDGYWGHGVNHPRVLEVPLAIFRLDGRAVA
jgi:membrane-anchored protein YejM (alkaline phosphatase superfamily)